MATKDTQQFCVRWNSYQSNLQSAFPKLLTNEHFVDVTLACESRMVKCHKVVLSACSAYFEKLLVQNPCQHPIIFMKDMKYWEVQALVDFMYKGEVNVTQEELASLLKAAEALEVRGLCGQHEQGITDKLLTTPDSEGKKRKAEGGGSASGGGGAGSQEESDTNPPTPQEGHLSRVSPPTAPNTPCTQESIKNENLTTTPSTSQSNVKTEGNTMSSDNGLFEDLDDDFYQDDNSLQIDETGSAYSLAGPSVQLDSSPEGHNWNVNNGYPNVILTESNYNMPSPSSETPGKIQRIRRSDAELLSAADSICKGMTFQKASQVFNIPMSTIRFYMARKGMLPSRRRGRRMSQAMEMNMMGGGGMGSGGGHTGQASQPPHPLHHQAPQQQLQMQQTPQVHHSYQHNLPMQPYFKSEPGSY